MISYIDTASVQSVAKNVGDLVDDFESEINNLFRRLNNVPTVTKEWVGGKANMYFSRVGLDKRQYTDMVNSLRAIVRELENSASDASNCINSNNGSD